MKEERLKKQMDFSLEIDKEKNIFRQTHLSGKGRPENDAEHAWHMAIMIYLLKEYANEEIDIAKAIMMALIHDVVEIDAGDAYAYDTEAVKLQKEKEAKAAQRIFGILPDDQREEMLSLFEEFEAHESPEANFVRVIDNLQPLMLNDANYGGDWITHNVSKTQIYKRNEKTPGGSEVLWKYIQELIKRNVERGSIRDE